MDDEILIEEKKKVYYITLNRPDKLNAINFKMMRQIKKCLLEAEENESIQLVVFRGAQCKAFSTGFDTKEILTLSVEKKNEFFEMNTEISEIALLSEKLSLSLIRGFAVAAGFAFCLFSDFRIVEDNPNVYFALPEIAIGVFPFSVLALSYYYLPPSVATSLIFAGERLSLQRAEQLGFIHRKLNSDEFEKQSRKFVRSLISQNSKVQRMTKVCYNIERKNILKHIQMEKDFTQVCLDPETITQKNLKELKKKWS